MLIKFFSWIGSKLRCFREIIMLIPYETEFYYEACAGGAAVLLNKHRHKYECINDLDPELYNLYKLMSDKVKGKILLKRLFSLKHDEVLFNKAREAQKNEFKGLDKLDMAVMTFILITQSFNAGRKSYRKNVSQRDYTFELNKHLPRVFKRLQNVEVKNMDAIELIDSIRENDKAFVLLDVPYLHELRKSKNIYEFEMPTDWHKKMLETIRDAKCKIMLCGYREKDANNLYDEYLAPYGWKHYKLADLPKSCQNKDTKDIAEEWVWLNYRPNMCSRYFINHSSINW